LQISAAMDLLALMNTDSSREVADIAVLGIDQHPELFRQALDLCFEKTYPVNMRASRVIQLYCANDPAAIIPYIEEIIQKVIISKNDGVKRCFLKVFAEQVDLKKISDPGPLLAACFDWLIDPAEAIAVRVHCMEVIYQISLFEPDLKGELAAILEDIMESNGTTGLKNRAGRILKKLKVRS
jgi:hypothetical protein